MPLSALFHATSGLQVQINSWQEKTQTKGTIKALLCKELVIESSEIKYI